jgi:N-acetylglucosamine-6-phosphate deacetylase
MALTSTTGFEPTVMPYKDDTTSLDGSLLHEDALVFTNCRLCISGQLTPSNSVLIASKSTGKILEVLGKKPTHVSPSEKATILDLGNKILAPAFLELQTNGMRGFHFTHFKGKKEYEEKLKEVADYLPSQGVTGFWVTIPTVKATKFQEVGPYILLLNDQEYVA